MLGRDRIMLTVVLKKHWIFSEIGKVEFANHDDIQVNGDNDLICCLSDLHIGQTFSSCFGEYNSSIAKKRLNDYLLEIIKIGRRHGSENVYLDLLGDQISGNIHLIKKM